VSKNADFSMADVEQILNVVDQLNDVEVEFQAGDVKLTIRKSSSGELPRSLGESQKPKHSPAVASASALAPASLPDSKKETSAHGSLPPGAVEVKAPMLGRYFAASSPDSAPFVSVGQTINVGETVALIEVMKLFNTVTAEQSGTIVDIRVENGQMVEHDQTLFVIQPD